jgi:8-oxo-dGTP diphosphatase
MDERALTARDNGGTALVGALIVRDGMLLLGRRSPGKLVCPDAWDVIGGHVEAGEAFEDALLRELEEEVGIRPLVYGERSRHPLPQDGMFVLLHVSQWAGGEPRLQNSEHVELRWFPIRAPARYRISPHRSMCRSFARLVTQHAFRQSGQRNSSASRCARPAYPWSGFIAVAHGSMEMIWQDVALGLAGGVGCFVAVVHGILIDRLVVKPIAKLIAVDARMASSTRRLVPPLLHLSTFAWLSGGLSLIGAAIWLGSAAKLALGMFVGSLYLFGAVANLWATRGRHPGWMLMMVALVLIVSALSGSGA